MSPASVALTLCASAEAGSTAMGVLKPEAVLSVPHTNQTSPPAPKSFTVALSVAVGVAMALKRPASAVQSRLWPPHSK